MSLMMPPLKQSSARKLKLWSLEYPFWLVLIIWSLLPSTRTPWFEIASIPINGKEILIILLAIFYILLPRIHPNPLLHSQQAWHYHIPILSIFIVIYASISTEWSGMGSKDQVGMIYTLIPTVGGCLLGYNIITKQSLSYIRSFLWSLTILMALVGLFYSATSFLSLGLSTRENAYEMSTFGIQRVNGPLYASTTGFFILVPALAFSIQELTQNSKHILFKIFIVFSLMFTIIGMGARSALLITAGFFVLMILSMKNKKQAITAFLIVVLITTVSATIVFSKARIDRLQSLEDTSRSETHLTSFKIIQNRDEQTNIFGSGYGSYWPWYLPDQEDLRLTGGYFDLVRNPFGLLLYHPHSTFLLLIVELGIPGLIYFSVVWLALANLLLKNFKDARFPIMSCGIFASGFAMFFDFFIFRSYLVNTIWWVYFFGTLALNIKMNSRETSS